MIQVLKFIKSNISHLMVMAIFFQTSSSIAANPVIYPDSNLHQIIATQTGFDTSELHKENNYISFYPNGQIEYYWEHNSDGETEGVMIKWFDNGQLYFAGRYKMITGIQFDALDSTHTGKEIGKVPVMSSEEVGEWRFYNENGNLAVIGNYDTVFGFFTYDTVLNDSYVIVSTTRSLKSGEWTYYDATGKIIRKEEWLHGNLKKTEYYGSE